MNVGGPDSALLTFDASTGRPGWSAQYGAAMAPRPMVPAVGRTIYVYDRRQVYGPVSLEARNARTGKLRWWYRPTMAVRLNGDLLVGGTAVYVSKSTGTTGRVGGELDAVSVKTGAETWRFRTKKPITSMAAGAGHIFVGTKGGQLFALRPPR